MSTLKDSWEKIQERIHRACEKSRRDPKEILVVGVTKTVSWEKISEAYQVGVRCFGENYVQEAMPKIQAIDFHLGQSDLHWHFVGALQTNKAKWVVQRFSCLHSLDRESLAQALEKTCSQQNKEFSCLVEINLGMEKTKAGILESEVKPFLENISSKTHLQIKGLMVFPPYFENPEDSRVHFQNIRNLSEKIKTWNLPRVSMKELSMGISHDFEVAIEEGSTMVRIGTALFGPRKVNASF